MNTTTEEPVQPAGWKQWFATHGSRLLLFARQQTRTSEDAEDVLQEAMLRLWRSGMIEMNEDGRGHIRSSRSSPMIKSRE